MTVAASIRQHRVAGLLMLAASALLAGLVVRTQHLKSLHPFEADERVWLLVGTSLLQRGVPASWTIFWEKYPRSETVILGGESHLVVTPYLDHPPVFGLAMGIWAALTGQVGVQPLNWAVLRLPMIFLAAGTLLITGLFVNRLFGLVPAAVTLIAFSSFPAHVIASRFIVAEQAIAFLLILGLYAFAVRETAARWDAGAGSAATLVILLVSSVAIMLKLSGIVIPATIGLLALLRQRWFLFAGTLAAALLSVGLLLLYGAYLEWDIFLDVLQGHAARPQSFWHFWSIFTQMDLGYFTLRDPSWIVGLIGLFALLANKTLPWEKRLLIFAPLLNLSLLFLFIAPVEAYGWYKYLWFPWLAIGLGYVFTALGRGAMAYYILLLPFIALLLEQVGLPVTHAQRKSLVLVLYGLVVATAVLNTYRPKIAIKPVVAGLVLAVLFFLELTWVSTVIPG